MKKILSIVFLSSFVFVANAQDSARYVQQSLTILQQLNALQYDKVVSQLDSAVAAKMDSARLGSAWRNLLTRAGSFKGIVDTLYDHQTTYDVVILQSLFGDRKIDVKTVYGRGGSIKGIFFLPTDTREKYKNPSYFNSDLFEEAAVEVVNGDVKLKGILSVPKNSGKVPAVILVHGSGPNDKDETVGATKIFRDFSVGLSAKGIAVLRYDKRTRALAAKLKFTKQIITPEEETVSDAIAAAELLKKDPRIDTSRIYYIGHSMGGYLLPQIASKVPNVKGMILLCPQARPLEDVMLEQTEYVLTLEGKNAAEVKSALDSLQKAVQQVKALVDANKVDSVKIMSYHSAYWIYLKHYDPFAASKSEKTPMLILQGDRDYQVTMSDYSSWKTNLKGRPATTFKSYPGLNHFFIKGTGKSSPEEYNHAGNVSEQVIVDISGWIKTGALEK